MELFYGYWEAGQEVEVKLKFLQDRIKVWNKESFSMVEVKKKNFLDEIHF